MKAYVIILKDHPLSEHGFKQLRSSHLTVKNDFPLIKFSAFSPKTAHNYTIDITNKFRWSWPWQGENFDMTLGIKKKAYQTAVPLARVACFLSHFHLWKKCIKKNEPILILEHDALFAFKVKVPEPSAFNNGVVSINDPRGATRKSQLYHDMVQSGPSRDNSNLTEAPWIDADHTIVQGLPGNSAYIIHPDFAEQLVEFVDRYGAWPNDATICKNIFPGRLFCMQEYSTTLQRLPSTTTVQ